MRAISSLNDFVIKFATVNGTGSASANTLFAKALFRMGLPVTPKNIFPSNIQGLPTWYEVRVSEKGYLGRRGGVDIMVSVNPQSIARDVKEVEPGGYFLYDSTKPLDKSLIREDLQYLGVPLTEICLREYEDPRQRQLFRNILYVGALSALMDFDFSVFEGLLRDQFKKKEKLVASNLRALELGRKFAQDNFECPFGIRVERRDFNRGKILMDGNSALALGAVYGGATVVAWYPITPSTSVIEAFENYAERLRIDPATGKKNFALVQAEDELSAIGVVVGAMWNGARSFTATSGPGLSLMQEFLGLAYFAEVPVVLYDVQRAGPSTGMPTRTQQADLLLAAYASHGDTKQILLFPSDPKETFEFAAEAFEIAERLQAPVIVMIDLDLGMQECTCDALAWDDTHRYDRGKILNAEQLESMKSFGRYLDTDGDGICYRTYPGTHPTKGSFFTRGTSRDRMAVYTEDGAAYVDNMQRLLRKWETTKQYIPKPETVRNEPGRSKAMLYFGTSMHACKEALDVLDAEGFPMNAMRLRAFPFQDEVKRFIDAHEEVFIVEQNRDGQMRMLLINELQLNPAKLCSIVHYDGTPLTSRAVVSAIQKQLTPAGVKQP